MIIFKTVICDEDEVCNMKHNVIGWVNEYVSVLFYLIVNTNYKYIYIVGIYDYVKENLYINYKEKPFGGIGIFNCVIISQKILPSSAVVITDD